jgi:hypothetical protein
LTLVLLDTNAYLRLAKRIRPMLGIRFGHKEYVLTILKDVEDEVHRNAQLKFKFPWFDAADLAAERIAKQIRLDKEEKAQLEAATKFLRAWVINNVAAYKNPPSPTDCKVLAFGQIRPAIVVTDDLSMHQLADEFKIGVWHGHELIKKMLSAKMITSEQVREIFEAVEINNDMPATWKKARHHEFVKIFGPERPLD